MILALLKVLGDGSLLLYFKKSLSTIDDHSVLGFISMNKSLRLQQFCALLSDIV